MFKSDSPHIQEASLGSLPALNRLFVGAVRDHFQYFPPEVQRRVMRDHSVLRLGRAALHPRRVVLVARSGPRLIGYAIGAAPRTGPAQLYWLYVEPDQRGQNTGLRLLSRMCKLLAAKGAAELAIATHDHRRFYERQGFRFVRNTMVDGVPMDILTFKLQT